MSMSTRGKRALLGLAVILALAYFLLRPGPPVRMDEYSTAEEEYLTSQIVASALSMINMSRQHMTAHSLPDYPPKVAPAHADQGGDMAAPNDPAHPYMRDVHSKTHGLLKATFTVNGNIDSRLRFGVFATPKKTYNAWIRFSSGNAYPQPDSTADARGMAIKLMGVEGPKLLDDYKVPHADTQDFALMNATQFFIRDIAEYADFTKYLSSGLGTRAKYAYFFGGFTIDVRKWHLREMMLAKKTLKSPPHSLLNTKFYSVSAYKLGPNLNVKYLARPCKKSAAADVDRSDPNFLRKEMVKRLSSGTACFDFMVQLQVPGKNMPVEDTTVKWSEDDSPFIPVARIEIPTQQFEANNDLAENLSFNPWHSLPEHRPIGVMNRIRRAVYLEISRYRRQMNGVPLCEPKDWYQTNEKSCEPQPEGAKPAVEASSVKPPTK